MNNKPKQVAPSPMDVIATALDRDREFKAVHCVVLLANPHGLEVFSTTCHDLTTVILTKALEAK